MWPPGPVGPSCRVGDFEGLFRQWSVAVAGPALPDARRRKYIYLQQHFAITDAMSHRHLHRMTLLYPDLLENQFLRGAFYLSMQGQDRPVWIAARIRRLFYGSCLAE